MLVGFAVIYPYSNLNGEPDYVLAEFPVFPMYHRKHLAIKAAEKYSPQMTRLNEIETVLSFCSA